MTDDSSDTETEDVYEDDESAAVATAATASAPKELEKSPKRPRPDTSRSNPALDQPTEKTPLVTDADETKDEAKKEEGDKPKEETQGSTTQEMTHTACAGDAPPSSSATER